jgi:tripartite-type tricarboxylate transporter receptor subunit TctC
MDRRSFVRLSGAMLGAASTYMTPAQAQQYPSQTIHFICAWPAGSGADTIVRFYAEKFRSLTNSTVIVENKPGAAGNIGMEYASKARPDGYTVLVNGGYNIASNMHLYKRPPIPSVNAFQVFATINRQAFTLTVDANKPYKTLADLTAAMKFKGDKATYAAGAPASVVAGYMYKTKAGLQAVEVSYRTSADMLNDLLGGMPAGTPRPIVDQLNKWFNQITASEDGKKFLNGFSADPLIMTPDEAQALLNADDKAWGEYVKLAKIQPQG